LGQTYSRREISDKIGGSIRSYLPDRRGRVVCGCFRTEPQFGPDAPDKVTAYGGPRSMRASDMLLTQKDPIPVFLRREWSAWEYVGDYRCTRRSTDPAELRREERANPLRGHIGLVLYFEKVGSGRAKKRK
jgi:hypothetical protein